MTPLILSPGIGDNAPSATLYYGQDVRESLRLIPDASIHVVCTSPPYFGLRDYGTGDKQIGLEPTPEDFVEALVEVFREIKRVLRPDGTLWVNLGDSYASQGGAKTEKCYSSAGTGNNANRNLKGRQRRPPLGLKPKDLMGIPWRVAFALQQDGWYLRNEIIWSKPNPMPASAKDRLTRSHEHVFLLAHPDSEGKYYYNQDAIREPLKKSSLDRNKYGWRNNQRTHDPNEKRGTVVRGAVWDGAKGSNKRTVWDVTPKPYKGAHFACWPPDLVRPMILAGTSEHGCCSDCGSISKGWEPSCSCDGATRVPCTVLDPFSGSATTGMVALKEGRNYVGIDLNSDYLDLAQARIEGRKAPQQPQPESDQERDVFDLFGGAV